MGRKTKKPRQNKLQQGPNIAELLRLTRGATWPKMAAYPETYFELLDNFSFGEEAADLPPVQIP
ncbi:Hypothetical predicted protein, partial [Pelobates cultripes]